MSIDEQIAAEVGLPTELPDSLADSAEIAARACDNFAQVNAGAASRCRVDFDTSVGDETYTTLKSSTEFMQKFVTALVYLQIPSMKEQRQKEMMNVIQARADLNNLFNEENSDDADEKEIEKQKEKLMKIISTGGKVEGDDNKDGPIARIYFPDEGSAALARRDWVQISPETNQPLVPSCVKFSSLGGVQLDDVKNDELIFFFCPRAAESDFVEEVLYSCEDGKCPNLKLSVFVNPLLVDMGVTGFGMAGRMLRERLIDPLQNTYYLRTLAWGALTRTYPRLYTVWQEDEEAEGGYKMIKAMDRLPSNPEVEDIYDIVNAGNDPDAPKKGLGLLDALGDFVNGMTKL